MINHAFISFSAVQIYDLSYIHLHPSPSWVYDELTPRRRDSSAGRALHRYRRDHGFNMTTALVGCITVMINHFFILILVIIQGECIILELFS